jgi:DNA-directed RNA polymerase subunit RPC12/RpoP
MEKCGICGKDVPEQPAVTDEGTCNQCGAKLSMTLQER